MRRERDAYLTLTHKAAYSLCTGDAKERTRGNEDVTHILVFFVLTFVSFFAAAFLTFLVGKGALGTAVMDIPNARSMHTVPVMRNGGMALLPVFLGGLFLLAPFSFLSAMALCAGLGILGYMGWKDDKEGAGVLERLMAHGVAATLGVWALGHGAIFAGALPFWADRIATIVLWVGFMNLYNFMDGIDGMTGTQTVTQALGAFFVLCLVGGITMVDLSLAAVLVGASVGFLLFNWHPAKIFLGDIGSVPIGFLVGFLLLRVAESGYWVAACLIPLYYFADGGITMMLRLGRKEKIWQAHKSHFYQRAAARLGRHDKVVWRTFAASGVLAWLAGVSVMYPLIGAVLGILLVSFLLFTLDRTASKKT